MNTPPTETSSPSCDDYRTWVEAVARQATEDILELGLKPTARDNVYTIVKYAILTAMKKLPLFLLLAFLGTGCTTVITPQGCSYRVIETGYSVVNNTGWLLDVVQDGIVICTDLETGKVMPLRNPLWHNKTVVVVTGHDKAGNYIGTATWTFISQTPEAWTVTRLLKPQL